MNTKIIINKRAFTLIEVLVSVIIITVVGTILFKISSDSKNNYIRYKNKITYEYLTTPYIFRKNLSNTNLYENIRKDYRIDSFDVRKRLKEIKLQKREKEFSQIKFDEENKIIIKIKQIQIYDKHNSSILYSIGM